MLWFKNYIYIFYKYLLLNIFSYHHIPINNVWDSVNQLKELIAQILVNLILWYFKNIAICLTVLDYVTESSFKR